MINAGNMTKTKNETKTTLHLRIFNIITLFKLHLKFHYTSKG